MKKYIAFYIFITIVSGNFLFTEEFLSPSDKKKLEKKDKEFAARKRKEKRDLMIKKAAKDLEECNKAPEPPSPRLTSAEERLGKIKPCSYYLEILQELKRVPSELIDVYELRKRELEECAPFSMLVLVLDAHHIYLRFLRLLYHFLLLPKQPSF